MTRALYTLTAVLLLLAGCGGTPSATKPTVTPHTATKPTAQPTIPNRTCGPDKDLIVWTRTSGGTPNAQILGAYQIADCKPTLDYLRSVSPTGPGDCTIAAWATDNPGYNADAVSPRRPRKAVEQIGGGC